MSDELVWKIRKHSTLVKDVVRLDSEGNLYADLPTLLEQSGFFVIRDCVWLVAKRDGSAHEVYVNDVVAKDRWLQLLIEFLREKNIECISTSLESYAELAEEYNFPWTYRREPVRDKWGKYK